MTHIRAMAIGALVATLSLPFQMTPVSAGPIENACMRSDRAAATRVLCGCIQQVANVTLNRRDQRAAARFFQDPDRAQQVRMSKKSSDNEFWSRYRNFGDVASASCSATG